MLTSRLVFSSFAVLASALRSQEETVEDFAALLKRQEPGTPAYNCHDNCGSAITISKSSSNVCDDEAFLSNYENCLQCAGPDNDDIWRYYGGTLSEVGEGCGLDTEPLDGEQEDVPPAQHPGGSESSASSSPNTSATPGPTSSDAASSLSTDGPTSSAGGSTGGGASASSTASGTSSFDQSSTASSTSSLPAEQTFNAATAFDASYVGMFGAIVMGLAYGF